MNIGSQGQKAVLPRILMWCMDAHREATPRVQRLEESAMRSVDAVKMEADFDVDELAGL